MKILEFYENGSSNGENKTERKENKDNKDNCIAKNSNVTDKNNYDAFFNNSDDDTLVNIIWNLSSVNKKSY